MKVFARNFFILLSVVCASANAFAQDQKEQKPGSVTGRVTIDGRAATGVIVLLSLSSPDPARRLELSITGVQATRTTTDENGNYTFSDVPAGRYRAAPYTLSHIAAPDSKSTESEREITVTENQTLEGIDFALIRGGVITGRVTDANGRPVIRETISLTGVDDSASARLWSPNNSSMFLTDDRGVYRLYGLPPGKYFVSAGGGEMSFLFTDRKTPRSYYPGVADRAAAKSVEVTAGGEAAGIDIRLVNSAKGYQASGRVIDGDTGKPLPNAIVIYMAAKDNPAAGSFPGGVSPSGSKGEFHFANISPGVYMATAQFVEPENEYYGEMVNFEVKNEDATGIEIKLKRGGSISGFAVIEDTSDPEILAQLSQMNLAANVTGSSASTAEAEAFSAGRGKINPDGSFRAWGLKPGKVHIRAGGYLGAKGLKLTRVERDGLDQTDGLELKAGEHITGVRLVFATSSGVIRGRVVIEGGPLPAGTTLIATAENIADKESHIEARVLVDTAGNFVIENLLPGAYEVTVSVVNDAPPAQQPKVKQTVNVAKDVPAEITLVLNLKVKNN